MTRDYRSEIDRIKKIIAPVSPERFNRVYDFLQATATVTNISPEENIRVVGTREQFIQRCETEIIPLLKYKG
jgi:hypothetical protein